jgi:hypothetical protein
MKVQEFEQGQKDANQLRSVYSQFGADTEANVNSLYKAGLGKEAGAYSKSTADLTKSKNDAMKSAVEAQLKKFELGGQVMTGVRDQATYDAARQQMAAIPELAEAAAKMPPVYNPQEVEANRLKAMSIKDQLEQTHKQLMFGESQRHNKATEGLTARGQNMTDARAREGQAMTLTKPFEITGEDGKPVLVQQDKQGNIKPVTGYTPKQGASKPLTDSQSKALLFGSRMQESGAILDQLAGEGRTTSIPGSRAPVVGSAITALGGEKNQKLEQAKRDFINATLRRESGAVIADSEFDNAEKQYFPQIGDAPAVIAQKKRNREVATRGILSEVPDSENRVAKVRATPAATAPNIDALLDKYK